MPIHFPGIGFGSGGGGGQTVGNESAVDLLIQQNEAKVNLANNLNGLGVSANASTETLNQLVNKVADVQADTTKQNIESIVVNAGTAIGTMNYHYVVKNGFVFYVLGTSLWYASCTTMKANATSYSTNIDVPRTEVPNFCTTAVPTGSNDAEFYKQKIWFTEAGDYLFVRNANTIQKYPVTFGEDTFSIDTENVVTYTPTNNGSSITIYWIDLSADGTKILISGGSPYIYDITNGTTTKLTGGIDSWSTYFFTENSDYPICEYYLLNPGANGTIHCTVFSLNGTELITYKETSSTYAQNNPIRLWRSFGKFKDNKGVFHIIQNVGYASTANNQYGYIMVNSTTAEIVRVQCAITGGGTFYYAEVVTVYEKNNKYYLFNGMCTLILDEDWNVIGNATVPFNWTTNLVHSCFIFGDELFVFTSNPSASSHKYQKILMYLGKKVALARTVSIDNTPTQVTYFAYPTTDNINSGIFD